MNDNDQMILMAITNNIHTMDSSNKFYQMNANNKNHLRKFIDSLEKAAGITNHSLAFENAFDWIKLQSDSGALTFDGETTPLQILYVSRGLINEMPETKTVLQVIASGQSRLKQPVIINTCAIILGELRKIIANF